MKLGKILFHGGIHPAGRKELTASAEPDGVLKPGQVIIPLRQHIGKECEPLVAEGDIVRLGQKIGDGEGLCVPVHASVSGRVIAVEPRPHPGGGMVKAVVIENDGLDTPVEKKRRMEGRPDREEVLRRIREAGVVGMGGAAFSTGVKADVEAGHIDTMIINGCECEPYITADDALLTMYPEQVLKGIMILADLLEPLYIVIAVEDNKKMAIRTLQKTLKDYPQIHLQILPTRYPQGSEKHLIYALTEKEVPSGKLPKDVGCGVFNAATCAAVYKAVAEEIPLVRRIVTVTGEGINRPQNMIVPIGTPVRELIEAAGGLKQSARRVICGGPMMGKAQDNLDVPVVKGTNAVLCLTDDVLERNEGTICIHCGRCAEVCPMHLQPLYLYQGEEDGQADMLTRFFVMDCIECGCCSYICPSEIPLVKKIRDGKQRIREVNQ